MPKNIFIGFFIFLFSISTYAENSPATTLTELLNNIHTLEANFTQTILDKNAKPLQQSEGKMALQRPGKFRWEVTKPTAQLIIANGSRLWIYDPDLEQVTIRSLQKTTGETPALLLSHTNIKLEKDFTIKYAKNISAIAAQAFILIPKDKGSMLESIKLVFRQKQISEMQLKDHLGHNTIIYFKQVKMGLALPASLFSFKPPAQVDVIDEATR